MSMSFPIKAVSADERSGFGGRPSASGRLEVLGERVALGVLATHEVNEQNACAHHV